MSLQDISLPYDIPWQLIATSDDMIANHDKRFPHAMWKSSMSVFSYDPDPKEDLPEELKNFHREITYLKVVCSITSYVPTCEECPPPPPPVTTIEDYGENQANLEAWRKKCKIINDAEHRAYACSGALVQVAIYPKKKNNETTDPAKLAYFASFEPKKRELIEVGTESGESITQSKSDLNVRKGATSTSSVDNYDVLTGVNMGGGFAGASAQIGVSGQWGTVKKSGSENVNVTNKDSSRELREGASHTSNISNLYHLLNSYHLGTNRAIFFLQPRPHTLQQKDQYTFIDGPQQIEGIQEFFLIVSRPDDMKMEEYCLDALLYTAHLDDVASAKALNDPKTAETDWIEFVAIAPQVNDGGTSIWNIAGKAKEVVGYIIDQTQNAVNLWTGNPDPSDTPDKKYIPATCDGYITPSFITKPEYLKPVSLLGEGDVAGEAFFEAVRPSSNSGWKIDRTRGLGGYDLWEDPNNKSGLPTDDDIAKAPPEAFVDVISLNTPDDIENYHPDYGLRVRAQTWPTSKGTMMYHGRIKAYYIRNDMSTNTRAVDMFVTVRGVSTCDDSPFKNYSPDKAVLIAPDIIVENKINPRNVSPWKSNTPFDKSVHFTSIPHPEYQDQQILLSNPKGNSVPSGLDHQVLGAARAKMANMIGKQVGNTLNSSLSCLAGRTEGTLLERYSFRQSDLFFKQVAVKLIELELIDLHQQYKSELGLTELLLKHSRFDELKEQLPSLLNLKKRHDNHLSDLKKESDRLRKKDDKKFDEKERDLKQDNRTIQKEEKRKIELSGSTTASFPILTLTADQLSSKNKKLFNNAGFHTIFDVIGMSSTELGKILNSNEDTVRKIRLQILGIYSKPRSEEGSDDNSKIEESNGR
jgi:hypothetical protein